MTGYDSPRDLLRSMRILFGALVAGVLIMLFIVAVINYVDGPVLSSDKVNNVFIGIAIIIALIGLAVGNILYKKGMSATRNLTGSLNHKLGNYRSVLIRYMATCEGPAIFSVLVFTLTGDARVLGITGIMLLAMWSARPTARKIVNTLNLDWREQEELTK